MLKYLIAPSGAGKSVLAAQGRWIDGDDLPPVNLAYRALSSQWQKHWWQRPDFSVKIWPVQDLILSFALARGSKQVLDGQNPDTIATAEICGETMAALANGQAAMWVPPAKALFANQQKRRQNGDKDHPILTLEQNQATVDYFMRTATDTGASFWFGEEPPTVLDLQTM